MEVFQRKIHADDIEEPLSTREKEKTAWIPCKSTNAEKKTDARWSKDGAAYFDIAPSLGSDIRKNA
jgi:hypothetical protein